MRRVLLLVGLLEMISCVILLANITAPNPAGRRYSSVPIDLSLNRTGKGQQGEDILAADLHLPDNNAPDQRQCFCNNANVQPSISECRTCRAFVPSVSTYRRPDFFADQYVAEVKNVIGSLYDYRDRREQISNYVDGAKALGIPLWLYVRVDTVLSPAFYRLVESTSGGVVHYLATPGYVDPVDRAATSGLVVAAVMVGLMVAWELIVRRVPVPRPEPTPKVGSQTPMDAAEAFLIRAKARARRIIGEE